MPIEIFNVNYLAVLIATVIYFGIGALWYSFFFGKAWTKAVGLSKTDLERERNKGNTWRAYVSNFLSTIVMVYVLSLFLNLAQASTILSAMFVALLIWLGFIATVSLSTILWEGKPLEIYLINISYHLISLNIAGIILTVL